MEVFPFWFICFSTQRRRGAEIVGKSRFARSLTACGEAAPKKPLLLSALACARLGSLESRTTDKRRLRSSAFKTYHRMFRRASRDTTIHNS